MRYVTPRTSGEWMIQTQHTRKNWEALFISFLSHFLLSKSKALIHKKFEIYVLINILGGVCSFRLFIVPSSPECRVNLFLLNPFHIRSRRENLGLEPHSSLASICWSRSRLSDDRGSIPRNLAASYRRTPVGRYGFSCRSHEEGSRVQDPGIECQKRGPRALHPVSMYAVICCINAAVSLETEYRPGITTFYVLFVKNGSPFMQKLMWKTKACAKRAAVETRTAKRRA